MEAFEVLKSAFLKVQELNIVVSALEFLTTKNSVIVQVVDANRVKGGVVVVSTTFLATTTTSNKGVNLIYLYAKEGQGSGTDAEEPDKHISSIGAILVTVLTLAL
jgi:hypothetical protein